MAQAAAKAADRALLKVKLGGALDPARIDAVRRAAPRAELIVDANEAWTPDDLAGNLAACAQAGVTLVEQPLPADCDDALARIARPIPICADESVHASASLSSLVGKYDAVNIKLDKTGGLTEAMSMAEEAERLGFTLMIGCMVATSLAMAPAMLVAQRARVVDLDGALLLARDRPDGCPTVRARAEISSPQTVEEPSRKQVEETIPGRCAVNGKQFLLALRILLAASLAASLAALLAGPAAAQGYPNRPVKIVMPFAPGGPTEFIIRLVADRLTATLGQAFVIENRPGGAGGTVGAKSVAIAEPDGYTLLFSSPGPLVTAAAVYKNLDYDPIKSFAPIAMLIYAPQMLVVHPSVPANSLPEFVAYARSNPGKITFGSSGYGTQPHIWWRARCR